MSDRRATRWWVRSVVFRVQDAGHQLELVFASLVYAFGLGQLPILPINFDEGMLDIERGGPNHPGWPRRTLEQALKFSILLRISTSPTFLPLNSYNDEMSKDIALEGPPEAFIAEDPSCLKFVSRMSDCITYID